MRKMIFYIPVVLLLAMHTSCVIFKRELPMYYWGSYGSTSEKFVKRADEKDIAKLKATYESMVTLAANQSTRAVPPPGICADYAFLLIQSGENDRGLELLKMEVAFYPESKIFIDKIIKALQPTNQTN